MSLFEHNRSTRFSKHLINLFTPGPNQLQTINLKVFDNMNPVAKRIGNKFIMSILPNKLIML